MNLKEKNIVIIGAGVIGLACAVRLVQSGHKVTLIDKDTPGKGTSFGNAGHIATEQIHPLASPQTIAALPRYLLDPTSPIKLPVTYLPKVTPWLLRFAYASRPSQFKRGTAALTALQNTAMADLKELLDIAGRPDLLHEQGNLVVLENKNNIRAAQKDIAAAGNCGMDAKWLNTGETRQLAPSLNDNIVGAIHFRGTGHVANPYSVSEAFEKYLRDQGTIFIQDEVTLLDRQCHGVTVHTTSNRITAEKAILTAGAFSKKLAQQAGIKMPLETERGYHIHLADQQADFTLPIASYERKIIVTPMSDGVRATGIVEFGGLKAAPNEKNFTTIKNHLTGLIPLMDTSGASTWMGYRPSLPDHLPAIGFSGKGKRVLCAFGHQHLGLTLSGVNARIVEQLVANETPTIDLEPFRPDRFS